MNRRTHLPPQDEEPILVVEEPRIVPLGDEQRRQAIAAITEILALWWRRHQGLDPTDSPVA